MTFTQSNAQKDSLMEILKEEDQSMYEYLIPSEEKVKFEEEYFEEEENSSDKVKMEEEEFIYS